MKLLFDQNLSFKLVQELDNIFPDSAQVHRLGLSQADDLTIWNYARQNGFAIVTRDTDFQELSILYGAPPKVILLRCGNSTTHGILNMLRNNFDAILDFGLNTNLSCLELR